MAGEAQASSLERANCDKVAINFIAKIEVLKLSPKDDKAPPPTPGRCLNMRRAGRGKQRSARSPRMETCIYETKAGQTTAEGRF
jgi:hypothetical protein